MPKFKIPSKHDLFKNTYVHILGYVCKGAFSRLTTRW